MSDVSSSFCLWSWPLFCVWALRDLTATVKTWLDSSWLCYLSEWETPSELSSCWHIDPIYLEIQVLHALAVLLYLRRLHAHSLPYESLLQILYTEVQLEDNSHWYENWVCLRAVQRWITLRSQVEFRSRFQVLLQTLYIYFWAYVIYGQIIVIIIRLLMMLMTRTKASGPWLTCSTIAFTLVRRAWGSRVFLLLPSTAAEVSWKMQAIP